MSDEKPMGQVIQIDEARIRDHLGEMVRGTVEETLNAMLDAEADQLCGAGRYERSKARSRCRRDGEPRGGAGDPDDRAAGLQQARRLGRRWQTAELGKLHLQRHHRRVVWLALGADLKRRQRT